MMTHDNALSLCALLLTSLVLEGVGREVAHWLKIKKEGFQGALGVAVVFCLLEILLIPIMVFNVSGIYAYLAILVVIVLAIVVSIVGFLKRKNTYSKVDVGILLVTGIMFFVIVMLQGNKGIVDVAIKDVFTNKLQGFVVLKGIVGDALGNQPATLLFKSLFNVLFAEVMLNSMKLLPDKTHKRTIGLFVYGVFLAPYQSYMLSYADMGQIWRILWISLLVYQIVVWLKSDQDGDKYAFMLYTGAGMFVASGFWLVALEIIYCLAAWLLYSKKLKTVFDITTMLFPLVLYGCLMLTISFDELGFLVLVAYTVFLILRSMKKYKRMMRRFEDYLFDHAITVMYVIIPLGMIMLNTLMYVLFKEKFVPYHQYITYMQSDLLSKYFFMSGNVVNYMLSGMRLVGFVWMMMKAQNEGEKQLRSLVVLFAILFINPLTMGLMVKVSTVEMYGHFFEVLLNPLIDLWLFSALYKALENMKYGEILFVSVMVCLAILTHIELIMGWNFRVNIGLVASSLKFPLV